MAVVATTTYVYVNTSLTQFFVQGSELVDRGAWSSSAFYAVNEVVQIGVDQYVALTANSNAPPTGVVDANWSSLVVLYEQGGSFSGAGSDAYARGLAEAAYYWGTTAYFWGTTAFVIGTDAYNLAITGTNMVIAETGSRIAADLSEAGTRSSADQYLQNQIIVEQGTRSQEDQYLQNQIIVEQGTRSQEDQYLQNQIITEQGTRSSQDQVLANSIVNQAGSLSAEINNRIAGDLILTWAGTNEANIRQAADQQIITIVETGTNTANSAWALAQLGTIIPPLSTLPDVSIPAPSAQQILSFNGSVWVAADAPSTIGFGGFTFFLNDTPSGTLTYDTLSLFPTGGTETVGSVVITTGSGPVVFMNHLSDQLNRTRIDAGVWEFNTYTSVDTGSAAVTIEILVRSIAGVETPLFSVTSDYTGHTAPFNLTNLTSQGSHAITLTDKLLARFSGTTENTSPVTLSVYHQGTAHDSHFHSPLVMSHNDLDGLQGGSANQFYHVTFDQNNALTGAGGYPSATNRFVTSDDPRLVGNAAYTLAQIGTNTGTAALNAAASAQSTADSAYSIAQIGTNTGTAALAAAASTQSTANSAFSIAQIGTNTGSTAYSVAQSAWALAQIGTNTGTAALAAAATAQSTANSAFSIAQIGTNTGTAAYTLAESGSSVAWAAYALAQIGTSTLVSTGTTPLSQAVNGTLYYSMTGAAYQTTTASSAFMVSVSNPTNGAEICAIIVSDGIPRALTYDSRGTFAWFGTQIPYTSVVAGKQVLVTFSCATGTVMGATTMQL